MPEVGGGGSPSSTRVTTLQGYAATQRAPELMGFSSVAYRELDLDCLVACIKLLNRWP
jgi:hypothetical protein